MSDSDNPTMPKSIRMSITRENLYHSIYQAMEDMSKIRFECINSGKVTSDNVEEYLQLASFLSKSLLGVTDEHASAKFESLVDYMNRTPGLVHFDPLQRRYWERHEPEFLKTLDTILVQIYGEGFDTLDKTHHLLSAVKCVCAQNEETNERRENILNSVLPVTGMVRGVDTNVLFAESLFSARAATDNLEGQLTFELGSYVEVLVSSMQAAREMGCLRFRAKVSPGEYVKLQKRFPDVLPEATTTQKGQQTMTINARINTAPNECESEHIARRLIGFIGNTSLERYSEGHNPEEIGKVALGYDFKTVNDKVMEYMGKIFPKIDAGKIQLLGDSLNDLESAVHKVVEKIYNHPEIFGYQPGDEVVMNDLMVGVDNVDETLWEGSEGEITKICPSVSVDFIAAEVKGSKIKKLLRQKGSIIEDVQPIYLETVPDDDKVLKKLGAAGAKPGKGDLPEWYNPGRFGIGTHVRLKQKYAEDFDIEDGDLDVGSAGVVMGYTYEIKYSKTVNKDGKVSKDEREEDEIHQAALERNPKSKRKVEDIVRNIISYAIWSSTSVADDVKFEVYTPPGATGYVHHEEVAGYDKCTLFIRKRDSSYIMTYITDINGPGDKENGIMAVARKTAESLGLLNGDKKKTVSDKKIIEFMAGWNGSEEDAIERVGKSLAPIYICMRHYKGREQVNFLEGRR